MDGEDIAIRGRELHGQMGGADNNAESVEQRTT